MKAHNLKTTSDTQVEYRHLKIERMPADTWALMEGHTPLIVGPLRQVVLSAEAMAAQIPGVRVDAEDLQPARIEGHAYKDRFTERGVARGYVRSIVRFRNADELYRYLANGSFQFWSPAFMKRDGDDQIRIYRRHGTVDSMTAWEIALHRLENDGELPDFIEVPAGTCPRCLSQYVSMPMPGTSYHCLECHYEHAD